MNVIKPWLNFLTFSIVYYFVKIALNQILGMTGTESTKNLLTRDLNSGTWSLVTCWGKWASKAVVFPFLHLPGTYNTNHKPLISIKRELESDWMFALIASRLCLLIITSHLWLGSDFWLFMLQGKFQTNYKSNKYEFLLKQVKQVLLWK